jgi:hypothetical protein
MTITPITHTRVTQSCFYQLHETNAYKSGSLQVYNIHTKFCENPSIGSEVQGSPNFHCLFGKVATFVFGFDNTQMPPFCPFPNQLHIADIKLETHQYNLGITKNP